MQQAQSAQTAGQRERARQAWRSAAKAHPTQKSPWQSLAQDYFEAADYGNAILAAQEVLQRDNQDALAHSVLAVSGLRLSMVSLDALRDRGSSYAVGSREEAMGLTRAMREALGESTQPSLPRLEAPARVAAPLAIARPAAPPVRAAPPAAAPQATPAATTVPAGVARGAGPAGAGAVVPVATTSTLQRTPRPAVTGPAPKAAATPVSNPKAAPADPFKLLN